MKACFMIRAAPGKAERVADQVRRIHGINLSRAVFGAVDVVARAEVKSLEELKATVDAIARVEGVTGSETLREWVAV